MVFESIAVARPKSARQALPDRVTRTLTSELNEPRSPDLKECGYSLLSNHHGRYSAQNCASTAALGLCLEPEIISARIYIISSAANSLNGCNTYLDTVLEIQRHFHSPSRVQLGTV